jgi:hypothetical protein
MRLRSSVVALLALVAAGCGSSGGDRFDLHTPGAQTGGKPAATLAPPPTSTPTPKPTPTPTPAPVTADEKRVIQGWSDALRHGRVAAAAKFFSVPAVAVNDVQLFLTSRAAVRKFNRGLVCGAKLLTARRGPQHVVVGTFRLTDRPGGRCGTGVGGLAAVQFLVRRHLIMEWLRADDQVDPKVAAKATPTPTPGP